MRATLSPNRAFKEGHFTLPDMGEIGDEAASRGAFGARYFAKAVKAGDREMTFKRLLAGLAVKIATWPFDGSKGRARKSLRHHKLARIQPRQFGLDHIGLHRHDLKIAGRNIRRRNADIAANLCKCHQHVRRPAIEQTILGQRARGYKADDIARHQRLAAARFGGLRAFCLLGDCNPVPGLNQTREIPLGGVDRNPAHRDWLTVMFAA